VHAFEPPEHVLLQASCGDPTAAGHVPEHP
jgi:hypothetical protein